MSKPMTVRKRILNADLAEAHLRLADVLRGMARSMDSATRDQVEGYAAFVDKFRAEEGS